MPKQLHSNIKDHWSHITMTNIIIMKSFEMWELPQCDPERQKWANIVGKMVLVNLPDSGLFTNLQFVKNEISVKHAIKWYACNKI